jgi:hypothetical protein
MVCGIRMRLACVGRPINEVYVFIGVQRWGEDDRHMLKDSTVAFAENLNLRVELVMVNDPEVAERIRRQQGAAVASVLRWFAQRPERTDGAAEAAWVDTPPSPASRSK